MADTGRSAGGLQQPVQPPVPVQQEFLFVDASDAAKTSRQGRRNARSFVMQKARRERPWSTSKHAAKLRKSPEAKKSSLGGTSDSSDSSVRNTPSPSFMTAVPEHFTTGEASRSTLAKQEICADCQIFLCRPGENFCSRCLYLRPPSPVHDVDACMLDPFGTASIDITGRECELINHFVTDMAPRVIAVDVRHRSDLIRTAWFGTAINHAGFMHSLLCTAALHLYTGGRCSLDTVFYHKAKAIESINSAISDPDPSLGISDANIGAVFNLLSVEEALLNPCIQQDAGEGQLNQREIHLNGLRRMLQMRGGLKAMSSNRILQAFILWHSTAHAVASFEVPYLFKVGYISTDSFPHQSHGHNPSISYYLVEQCRRVLVKESLIQLVESVLLLIRDLNVWFEDLNSRMDPVDIQNSSCVLECQLLNWLRNHDNCTNPLEDALCIALLIFTVRVTEALQNRARPHPLHFVASKRLEKALSATSCNEWHLSHDLLIWILVIGAINAEGSCQFEWYLRQTSYVCVEDGISSAVDLLDRLHICGWVRFRLDDAVHGIWENMLNIRPEPSVPTSEIVGPLQSQVAEPNRVDWLNTDWDAWSSGMSIPEGGEEYPVVGDETLFDFGMNYVYTTPMPGIPNWSI